MRVPGTFAMGFTRNLSRVFLFQVSLEAFQVERPSLLMVPVDDALDLETKFQLKEEGK